MVWVINPYNHVNTIQSKMPRQTIQQLNWYPDHYQKSYWWLHLGAWRIKMALACLSERQQFGSFTSCLLKCTLCYFMFQ